MTANTKTRLIGLFLTILTFGLLLLTIHGGWITRTLEGVAKGTPERFLIELMWMLGVAAAFVIGIGAGISMLVGE